MTTAAQVLAVARNELGYTERPHGSNRTKYGQAFGLDGVPWCSIFMWWVFKRAHGNGDLYPEIAYTPAVARWFQEQGRYGDVPRVGAIALFDFPDSLDRIQHVGIVEAITNEGHLQTIEGNTSAGAVGSQSNGGGVYRRTRHRDLVVVYGYPRYSAPAKPPAFKLARVLHRGLDGKDDRRLQQQVGCKDDGIFGPSTEDHVKAFQHRKGLVVDGVVGEKTARALGWSWAG